MYDMGGGGGRLPFESMENERGQKYAFQRKQFSLSRSCPRSVLLLVVKM